MKQYLLLIAAIIFLGSCSDTEQKAKEHDAAHKESAGKLTLNNGKKWDADSITIINVNNLQAVIEKFNAPGYKSLEAYKTTGKELQAGIDKLVADCKMKGPDHDALHQWLLPMIDDVSKLNKSTGEVEASDHMKEINERLKMFGEYFE